MKIYTEISLKDFKAWSGAVDTMETLEMLEDVTGRAIFDILEILLESDGIEYSDTEINDFLWFENESIADWLGFSNWEELERVANGEEEEEEIELEFSVGDVVKYKGYEGRIVEIDRSDKELPYRIKFIEFGRNYWNWASADEVTEWEEENKE